MASEDPAEDDVDQGTSQPLSRQPSSPFTATPRRRAASPPEQSRWSTSTISTFAPSLHATPSVSVPQSPPPLPRLPEHHSVGQHGVQPRNVPQHSPRHDRNNSAPSAWRAPVTPGNPSRTSSQASFARSLSASSREVPLMLQIDEDAPPVPPIPEHQASSIMHSPLSDINLSSPQDVSAAPVPSPLNANAAKATEMKAPSSALPGPSNPATDAAQLLRSKFFVSDPPSRAKSAAPAVPQPTLAVTPQIPPPSKMKIVTGPPSSYRPPRHPSPIRIDTQVSPKPPNSAGSTPSVLTRIGTQLRKSLRNPARYHKLDDDAEREIPMGRMHSYETGDQAADGEMIPITFDISTFEGPAHLQTKPSTKQKRPRRRSSGNADDDADILESKGHLTGGLGGGMDDVLEAEVTMPPNSRPSLKVTPPRPKTSLMRRTATRWRKQPPSSPNPLTQAGQEAADRSGQVVAIEEGFVDLSNVEGGMGGADTPKDINLMAEEAAKQSYYFPPDPEMPNWRPMAMQPWYLLLLLSIAIAFFAVFEHLVQISGPGLITFEQPSEVPNGLWFVWKYLGEILTVTYGVMFQATDFEVRRLEPYYQMSRPGGSKASESLNMDYLTFWSYLIPFKAVKHRQWAVVCSSLSTILSSAILPVLYSAAVNLNPPRGERTPPPGGPPIKFMVQMDPVWTRIMEATLTLIFVSTSLLLFQQRRKSGLTGDLKGVAGIATMATKSHVLNDFRGLDRASHQTIHKQLAHRRYILHKGSLWQGEYITSSGSEGEGLPKPKNPHPGALHLPIGFGFMSCILLFIALIPVFEFNPTANTVTDKAPWFLPLLATLLKLAWTNLETGVRMIEPFYRLSHRHAHPNVLLIDYTGTIPGLMPTRAIMNKHFLLGAVGIGSLLGEVLQVCVSSFNVDGQDFLAGGSTKQSNSSGETKRTFFTSFAIAETIPVIMLVILVFVYLRRHHAFLPRQPGTIASVLAFVHQSRMLYDFVAEVDDYPSPSSRSFKSSRKDSFRPKPLRQTRTWATFASATSFLRSEKDQQMDIAERTVRNLALRGKTYGLGWYRGRDGQDHVGVDEEELLHDYEHGVDWSKSHMGADIGRWEHL